jgi:hypothetical protein
MKMKKLVAIILMLGISLPALAVEVKLLCVSGDRKRIVTFDEEAGLVNGLPINGHSKITEGLIHAVEGDPSCNQRCEIDEVNRYDGSYSWASDSGGLRGVSRDGTGTCAPAKKAF